MKYPARLCMIVVYAVVSAEASIKCHYSLGKFLHESTKPASTRRVRVIAHPKAEHTWYLPCFRLFQNCDGIQLEFQAGRHEPQQFCNSSRRSCGSHAIMPTHDSIKQSGQNILSPFIVVTAPLYGPRSWKILITNAWMCGRQAIGFTEPTSTPYIAPYTTQ